MLGETLNSSSTGLLAPPSMETYTAKKPDCQDIIELQRYKLSVIASLIVSLLHTVIGIKTPTDWTTKQIKNILKSNIAIDYFSETVVLNFKSPAANCQNLLQQSCCVHTSGYLYILHMFGAM